MKPNDIAVLRSDAHTVGVKFDGNQKVYTYITTLDLAINDRVVAPFGNVFNIGRVKRIDPVVALEDPKRIVYKWIVDRVDFTEYDKNMAANKALTKLLS